MHRSQYKYLSSILFCSMAAVAAHANPVNNNSLKGTVTDAQGQPLSGAVVMIPDLKNGTVTDLNGGYVLDQLPKGHYLVEVRMLGFATQTTPVSVDGATQKDFTLSESIVEKNEVVVTGTSLATQERKSPTPILSVRLKELQTNPSSNIIDALTRLPGVSQLSTGPAVSKPVIRGLGYNRIITIGDGVRQEGQQWGDEHGIEIDDYNVSRVEVLKGPASLAYGSDALAGVINIISDEPLPQGKIQGNVALNYQTNNGQQTAHAGINGNNGGISWGGYFTGKRAHDYQNAYDGYVTDSRFSNANFGAHLGISRRWGYSRLSFTSFNQELGIPEGDRDSATGRLLRPVNNNGLEDEVIATDADGRSYSQQIPRQRIVHQKLAWNNSLFLNNGGRIGLTLGYQQNSRKEYGDVLAPDEPGLSMQLRTFTYDARYFFPEWKGWQLSSGINGMVQHNTNKGDEFLVPDYTLWDGGVFGIARREIGKWDFSGGLRYDVRQVTGKNLYLDSNDVRSQQPAPGDFQLFRDFDRSFRTLTGSIGASYELSQRATLKANFASGYRAPNIAELSANGVHEGTIRYEYGNTDLKPERSYQADLGLTYNAPHFLVDAAVFYNHINNYTYLRKLAGANGSDSIPALHNDGYAAFLYDQTDANLYGGELYVDLHPHPFDWLHLENTFSVVWGRSGNNTDSTRDLPFIPAPRWIVELKAEQKKLGHWLGNAYAKVGLDINFRQNEVYSAFGTETPTAGYTLLNAGIGADVLDRKGNPLCTLSISGSNLGDVAYQSHLSRLKYAPVNYATGRTGIYSMGRNFSISLSVPLNIL